jgi:molecular chaperone DnaJ
MRDPYEVLGVPRGSDKETIKKAYRKLASQWHPDRNPDNQEEATAKFKEISAAFEAIENPQKQSGRPFSSPMNDVFSSFFGREQQQRQVQGDHIILECRIHLEDVLHGGNRQLKFWRNEICGHCNGVGGTEGVCNHCNGAGARVIHGASMTVKSTCHGCGGTGKSITDKCQYCDDGYIAGKEDFVSFDIPVGVETGMRFAYKGLGQPSKFAMGAPGNLYISIVVEPHEKFEFIGDGIILYKVIVDYTQLVLGATIDVPTLESSVDFKIPAGTLPGQKFRLRELGLPRFSNRTGGIYTRGDQLVEVQLNMPSKLDERYRNVIEQLAQIESEQRESNARS